MTVHLLRSLEQHLFHFTHKLSSAEIRTKSEAEAARNEAICHAYNDATWTYADALDVDGDGSHTKDLATLRRLAKKLDGMHQRLVGYAATLDELAKNPADRGQANEVAHLRHDVLVRLQAMQARIAELSVSAVRAHPTSKLALAKPRGNRG